ncbi:MAG: DNA-3-methyladenine glycosylase [Mesorhizobium sp.]|nr:MAG: DNA-3-methyladenine glycosylase [Mesorhizobium sp.]RWQ21708.1 MAG: DNA-3-methyladenine glycosylase [Mesorhizobium sp.]
MFRRGRDLVQALITNRQFFARDACVVARDMIGATLLVHGVGGIVVETEAYRANDPASHSFCGRTSRNSAMFGASGSAYVYRSYGLHWCLNAVCLPGSAVLVRAIEPQSKLDLMRANRGVDDLRLLCSGPGRLCEALAVDASYDGLPLDELPFQFKLPSGARTSSILTGHRVGISKAVDLEWRFGLAGSSYLSRKF